MNGNESRLTVVLFPLLFLIVTSVSGQSEPVAGQRIDWIGPDGETLTFESPFDIEEYLATARVISVEPISEGITRPKKLLLVRDGIRMHAIFRYVDVYKRNVHTKNGIRHQYRDSALFELASYRLTKLLGERWVPPVVFREFTTSDFIEAGVAKKLPARKGTLQAWVENAMTEKHRLRGHVKPPDLLYWAHQRHMMTVFDNLIFNDDRNQGNILIGPDWRIWFIDATRAFRPYSELLNPEKFMRCDRQFYYRLAALKDEEVVSELEDLLLPGELRALLNRINKLRTHIEDLMNNHGQEVVLFEQRANL